MTRLFSSLGDWNSHGHCDDLLSLKTIQANDSLPELARIYKGLTLMSYLLRRLGTLTILGFIVSSFYYQDIQSVMLTVCFLLACPLKWEVYGFG